MRPDQPEKMCIRDRLNDWQILQVLLPKFKPPLKNRVIEALSSTLPVEDLHSSIIKLSLIHILSKGIVFPSFTDKLPILNNTHTRIAESFQLQYLLSVLYEIR